MNEIDPIEDALLFLEAESEIPRRLDPWTDPELRELKRICEKPEAPNFAPELYRGMIAHRRNWTHRAGRLDINQIEQFQQEYYDA